MQCSYSAVVPVAATAIQYIHFSRALAVYVLVACANSLFAAMVMVMVVVVMMVDAVSLQRRQLADLLWRFGYR